MYRSGKYNRCDIHTTSEKWTEFILQICWSYCFENNDKKDERETATVRCFFGWIEMSAKKEDRRLTDLLSYLAAPTDDAYLAACKKRGFTPNSEILEDGTRAHWIGSSKAEKLVLNFHGAASYPSPSLGVLTSK
jgi:hypothetical protein